MRSKLIKSFLVVFTFWWVVTALSWSVADPELNLNALRRVAQVLHWLGIGVSLPTVDGLMDAVTLQLRIQLQVLRLWSLPMVGLTMLGTVTGVALVWSKAIQSHKERDGRIAKSAAYRGVSVTLGPLPQPRLPESATVTLRPSKALEVLSDGERAVLSDVLGLIAAQPTAFAGANREPGSLLKNTIAAAQKALGSRHQPGLAAVAAAANELGKLTAWAPDGEGGWTMAKNENRESARLLAGLDSWYALPYADRMALTYAVKYRGRPGEMPESARDPNVYRIARSLLEVETEMAAKTPEEIQPKTTAYERRDPDAELLEIFERELSMLPFQSPGLPKNIPAAGWKKNGRCYLLENQLANNLAPKLTAETRAAFVPANRDKTARVTPMTAAFLRIFESKGWLVLENGPDKVAANEALWVIQAGKLEFSRVMILNLPPDLVEKLPPQNSLYDVVVKRPMFQSAVQTTVSKDDLMGGMLRPKSPAAAKPAEVAPEAPPPAGGS